MALPLIFRAQLVLDLVGIAPPERTITGSVLAMGVALNGWAIKRRFSGSAQSSPLPTGVARASARRRVYAPAVPPDAEAPIDIPLVLALLKEQHPDLAGLSLVEAGEGWDNQTFRLGNDLAVRLPRRAASAPLIELEQRWLPSLALHLPLQVPSPLRIGRPGCGFPWRWSVTRW